MAEQVHHLALQEVQSQEQGVAAEAVLLKYLFLRVLVERAAVVQVVGQ
jgi:hypothetical protein